jgi:hypothetical protein
MRYGRDNSPMNRYCLRPSEPADEPALLNLFRLVFGQLRTAEEWQWKFVSSRTLAREFAPVESLVAVDEQGGICGFAGALLLPGWFRGQRIPFVQVCDVMVHPDHRGGIGRSNLFTRLLRDLLERIAVNAPMAFRYGFPGRRPYLLGERVGVYQEIEVAYETEITLGIGILNLCGASSLDWGDPRLDDLWARLGGQYELGLVRDRAYLSWRYANSPAHDYRLTGITRFGRLVGCAVSRQQAGRLLIVDVLLPRQYVWSGLKAAASLVCGNALTSAWVWLPPTWRGLLPGDHLETPVITANMCWHSGISTDLARQSLYYTMGDVDIF